MSDTNYFKTFLSELDQADSKGLSEALSRFNNNASVRKVPLFGKPVDIIYVGESNSFLLVKFDFFDASKVDQSWLADEESCGLEPPLYFSQSDHRVSPVYDMQRAKCVLSLFHPDAEIEMLLVCNYTIVNYELMEDVWGQIGITVIHEIDKTVSDIFRPSDDDKRLLVQAAAAASIQSEESDLDKAFPALIKKVFNSEEQHEFSENGSDSDTNIDTDTDSDSSKEDPYSDFPFGDERGRDPRKRKCNRQNGQQLRFENKINPSVPRAGEFGRGYSAGVAVGIRCPAAGIGVSCF